jgi:tetratricopeptide (TPR) repeat protein
MAEGQKDVPQVSVQTLESIGKAIADVDAGNLTRALEVLARHYEPRTERLPPEGLSYYGLCLAKLNNEHGRGVELCRESITLSPYHGKSYVNLARIFLMMGERKRAIEAIELGLKSNPKSAAILKFRNAIGYRRKPVIPFLPREHAVNVTLGRLRSRKKKSPRAK